MPKWYPVSLKVDLAENGAELYWNVDFVIWIVTEPLGNEHLLSLSNDT